MVRPSDGAHRQIYASETLAVLLLMLFTLSAAPPNIMEGFQKLSRKHIFVVDDTQFTFWQCAFYHSPPDSISNNHLKPYNTCGLAAVLK